MNYVLSRKEALEWFYLNVGKWPTDEEKRNTPTPQGWEWSFAGDSMYCSRSVIYRSCYGFYVDIREGRSYFD